MTSEVAQPRPLAALMREALAFYDCLVWYLLKQVGKRAVAEDLAQEVYRSLLTSRTCFVPGSNLKAYLLQIAKHKLVDWYKQVELRRRFELPVAHDIGEEDLAPPADDEKSEENFGRLSERLSRLLTDEQMGRFRLLPTNAQRILWLSARGYSAAEVGERVGLKAQTCRTTAYRTRQYLSGHVPSYGWREDRQRG